MKRLIASLALALALCALWVGCVKDDDTPGSIYGVVTDKATGEPIKTAGVELMPLGLKTVTGSEGQFEFLDLKPGKYNLYVTKTGYTDLKSSDITVVAGQPAKGDVQIERNPGSLTITDDNGQAISVLDFGGARSDVARSFNIFNDGPESIEWEITYTAQWIKSVSKQSGILSAGGTQAIIVTIDRALLASGENTTTLHVTSNSGSRQLTIRATNGTVAPTVSVQEATDVHSTSATLHGTIMTAGTPSYTERGFVYSTSSMPTLENTIARLTAAVSSSTTYTAVATDLTMGQTYYVRAYAVNPAGTAYSSNQVTVRPQQCLPTVTTSDVTNKSIALGTATLNGNITYEGDPAYTERGFVYGQSHNPVIENDTKKAVTGHGTGVFNTNVTGLVMGNTYYVRAYATNTQGTAYGAEKTMDFHAVLPSVTTNAATNVTGTSADLNGTINSVGDPAYTQRGFLYGTMPVPTFDEEDVVDVPASGTGTGAFVRNISNLTIGQTYYFRAYARNGENIAYGAVLSFVPSIPGCIILASAGLMVQTQDLGAGTWTTAYSMCQNSTVGGFTDWRLPTQDELMVLYNNKDVIGGFTTSSSNSDYWSVTSCSSFTDYYIEVYFYNGSLHCMTGSNSFRVRAVRTYTP